MTNAYTCGRVQLRWSNKREKQGSPINNDLRKGNPEGIVRKGRNHVRYSFR